MDAKNAPDYTHDVKNLTQLDSLITLCRACPRLVAWREEVAVTKRAAFSEETYWGKAVPGFGPESAKILVVGLAPAAHGANRTGRMFTGDRSGDFLYASLFRVGLANQAQATNINDGLTLYDVRISSPVRCAPPKNLPTALERDTCAPFLAQEIRLLANTLKVIVVLGGFGWSSLLNVLKRDGWLIPTPKPVFGHKTVINLTHPDGRFLTVIGCYHVSQQNTFTGRLTPQMLDETFMLAKDHAKML